MNLSNCRELKRQVLGRAYTAPGDIAPDRRYRVRGVARAKDVGPEALGPVAAVGVAPLKGKQYKLAVRLFKGCERHRDSLMKGLGKYQSEIDLAIGIRYRPRQLTVRAGGSCGHFRITAGTLGGFVEDASHYYIMSNNHVLANSNFCFGGDPILQPGPADVSGGKFSVIGRLDQWFPLSTTGTASFDVAIARFSESVAFFEPWSYQGIGTIKKSPVTDRFSVLRVTKRGRTTGVTRGVVSAFELDGVQIDYGTASHPGVVTYDDQIEVIGSPVTKDFSQPGDSGSFIIDLDTMKVYALLYGGGRDSQGIDRTLAHFIPDVLGSLNVKLVQ